MAILFSVCFIVRFTNQTMCRIIDTDYCYIWQIFLLQILKLILRLCRMCRRWENTWLFDVLWIDSNDIKSTFWLRSPPKKWVKLIVLSDRDWHFTAFVELFSTVSQNFPFHSIRYNFSALLFRMKPHRKVPANGNDKKSICLESCSRNTWATFSQRQLVAASRFNKLIRLRLCISAKQMPKRDWHLYSFRRSLFSYAKRELVDVDMKFETNSIECFSFLLT